MPARQPDSPRADPASQTDPDTRQTDRHQPQTQTDPDPAPAPARPGLGRPSWLFLIRGREGRGRGSGGEGSQSRRAPRCTPSRGGPAGPGPAGAREIPLFIAIRSFLCRKPRKNRIFWTSHGLNLQHFGRSRQAGGVLLGVLWGVLSGVLW